jgi:hypothetical protein
MNNQRGYTGVLIALIALAFLVISFAAYSYFSKNNEKVGGRWNTNLTSTAPSPTTEQMTGNGAPSGPHYNLNVIGVPKDKTADMTGSQGHRIFVPLAGKCKINLGEGDFQVIDGNCTDNNQASFQLPNPDPENDGTTAYSVWARALGKPGGSSTTTTCATDPTTGELWCSVYNMVAVRENGKSTFTDVSKELLYIYIDLNADGVVERYNLFNSALQDYFWQYDNNGLKLLQLRFYPIASVVE